jgi:hypothetical protein
MAVRHEDACGGDAARELDAIDGLGILQGSAGNGHEGIDGDAFGVLGEVGQDLQHAGPVAARFAHAEDAAAADLEAGGAHLLQGIETVLEAAGVDDLGVVFRGGVDVVIVVVETGGAEALGLMPFEHAQGHAGFQTQGFHAGHHGRHFVDILVMGAAPGGAHAEALGALGLGRAGGLQDLFQAHEGFHRQGGMMVYALGAVAAVFGAAAGLDGKQGGALHGIGVEVGAVDLLGLKEQVIEGQVIEGEDLFQGPVVA